MTRPVNPYVVLALAVLLPGVGHVAAGRPLRGLSFAFFTMLLGFITLQVAPSEASFIGRHAGGLFVWALSIPDAYRVARLRYATWRQAEG